MLNRKRCDKVGGSAAGSWMHSLFACWFWGRRLSQIRYRTQIQVWGDGGDSRREFKQGPLAAAIKQC